MHCIKYSVSHIAAFSFLTVCNHGSFKSTPPQDGTDGKTRHTAPPLPDDSGRPTDRHAAILPPTSDVPSNNPATTPSYVRWHYVTSSSHIVTLSSTNVFRRSFIYGKLQRGYKQSHGGRRFPKPFQKFILVRSATAHSYNVVLCGQHKINET